MTLKNKIIAIILGILIISSMMPATTSWAAEGSTFTADTMDGHTLTYLVLTEDSYTNTGTVQVGVGESGNRAISGIGSGSLTIPQTVTNDGITYSVTSIGDYAFESCSGFAGNLTIGNSIQTIGSRAFYGCNFTDSLTIPDSVHTIGAFAFAYCDGFTGDLTISDSVTSVGDEAFLECGGFTGSLTIGDHVQTIGEAAFGECNGLSGSLIIPDSVTLIGPGAFYECSGFTGGLTIPDSVEGIGGEAFKNCSGFTGDLTIPDSVTYIGDEAFFGCVSLDNASFLGNKPDTFGESVFDSCKSGFTLYYPQDNSTWDGYTYDGVDIISVAAYSAPTITATTLPVGTQGVEYEYSLAATGTEPITWILSGGSLPDGIDLESDGDLSGTPLATGTFNFTVMATNTSGNDTQALSIVINPVLPTVTSVTVNSSTISVQKGNTQDFTATVNGTNSPSQTVTWSVYGNNSGGTFINSSGLLTVAVDETAATLTVTATSTVDTTKSGTASISVSAAPTTTYNPGAGGGGGEGGGSGNLPSVPTYKADIEAGNGTETTLPVTVNKDRGSASIDLGSQSSLVSGGSVIMIPSIPGVDTYSVGIPVPVLSTIDGQGTLTLDTDAGSITVPSNMLTGVSGISGSRTEITIGEGNKSGLPEDVKASIGDRPLVQLTLSVDGKQTDWSNPDAPVTVSIPYTPTAAELANPESIVIWYIDGSGNVITIPNGRYNPSKGTVTFFTTHFSNYAVTYVHKTFSDLGSVEKARKAIEVITSKGIASGTGNGTFSPAKNISRADYIVWLINTLGLTTSFNGNFDDVKPGAYYYNAVGVAKELGIAQGSGNNRFNPAKSISRQDMMVLASRALVKYQGLKAADNGTVLKKFKDKGDIAQYAVSSLATLVNAGLIQSSGDKLNPRSYATRAEVAVFLYNIYNKYPEAPVIAAATLPGLAGQTGIDTALSVAKATYPDKVTNAVLATADNYPDALTGSVLAYQRNAPILLVCSVEPNLKN